SRRRHTRFSRDWSSDVCSSDLMSFGPADATSRKAAKRPLRTQPVVTITPLPIGNLPSASPVDIGAACSPLNLPPLQFIFISRYRSEERRVGKEGRLGV